MVVSMRESAYKEMCKYGVERVDYDIKQLMIKGIPLPKGHGRLIDADAVAKKLGLDKATKYGNADAEQQDFSYSTMMMYEIADIFEDAEVVVEADEEV